MVSHGAVRTWPPLPDQGQSHRYVLGLRLAAGLPERSAQPDEHAHCLGRGLGIARPQRPRARGAQMAGASVATPLWRSEALGEGLRRDIAIALRPLLVSHEFDVTRHLGPKAGEGSGRSFDAAIGHR